MGELAATLSCASLNRFIYRLVRGVPFRSERDAVGDAEWLLRKVPSGNADYYDASLKTPLQRIAFRPNKHDVDGISFFREIFVSPRSLGYEGRKPPYYVVRLRARQVAAIGLRILPCPDPDQPPGHLVLPDLCFKAKQTAAEKEAASRLQVALRDIASLAFDPTAAH